MKNRTFPMASVLSWREEQKDLAEQALARALQAEVSARRNLQEARTVWANLAEGAAQTERWTAGTRAQHWTTLQTQEEHCRRLAKELEARSQAAAKERQLATAAYQNYEIVRRLEEKWRKEEERNDARRAQKALDEFAIGLMHRRALETCV